MPEAGQLTPRRVPRSPALDGLRGLAIAAVALFHYPSRSWLPGGLFGVGVFFTLSGLLITPILLEEQAMRGRLRFGRFLSNRAWRLLPALLVFLFVMLVGTVVFGHSGWFQSAPFASPHPGRPLALGSMLKGIAAALTYTYNFFLAWSQPMPAPLGHLWTLAVEGQFYVAWALLLPRLARRGPKVVMGVTVGLIALSATAPFVAWGHPGAENWIYFASLPRVQQLLAGSLLGELFAFGYLQRLPSLALKLSALAGTGAIAYLMLEVGNVQLKYLGAMTIVAVAAPLLSAHLIDERASSAGKRLLGSAPLRWLGTRSYAVYLWHWPLAEWTNQLPHIWGEPLGLGCSLIAAELSWRLVEQPAMALLHRRRARSAPRPTEAERSFAGQGATTGA